MKSCTQTSNGNHITLYCTGEYTSRLILRLPGPPTNVHNSEVPGPALCSAVVASHLSQPPADVVNRVIWQAATTRKEARTKAHDGHIAITLIRPHARGRSIDYP